MRDQSHFYVKKHAAGLFHLIRKKKQYAGPVPLLCKKTRCGIIPLNKAKKQYAGPVQLLCKKTR